MDRPLRILNIEDSERDSALLTRHMKSAGYDLILERVETAEAMKAALHGQEWDLILCDYSMPRFSALAALTVLRATNIDVPFIIISGTVGEEIAVEAMLTGANDYIPKGNLTRLIPAIERELAEGANRSMLRGAESARHISEERYRTLFEYAPDGIIISSPDDYYLDANSSMCQMLGYAHKELIGMHAADIVIRAEAQKLESEFAQVQSGPDYNKEWHFKRKDGSVFPGEVIATIMPDGNLLAMIRDISERNRAYAEIRQAEENYRSIFENSSDGIFQNTPEGQMISANPALARIYGFSTPAEMIREQTDIASQGYADPTARAKFRYELEKDGFINGFEYEIRRKDGTSAWVSENTRLVHGVSGAPSYYEGSMQDITERKRAEQALTESEERYRDLVENAIDMIYTQDLEGNYTSINKAAERITGYTREETLTRNMAQSVPPETRELIGSKLKASILAGQEASAYEVEIVAKDGHRVAVEVNTRIIRENGVPVGVQGIARDITERKIANEALRESESRLRAIIETSPECVKLLAEDGSLLQMNPAGLRMIEADSFQQVANQSVYGLIANDDRPAFRHLIKRVFQGESGKLEYEIVGLRGTHRSLDTHVTPLRDASGKITALLGITRDVTESKRAAEALRESNEKFHQLADNITDAFWIRSTDMKTIHYISPAYEKIWGRTLESNNANPDGWYEFILPLDRQRVREAYASLMGDAPNIEVEFRIVRPDEEIRWVRARGFQVRDAAGALIRLAGIVTDITESKHAIEALGESEERYRELVEDAIDIIYTLDVDGNYTSVNKACENITGYLREQSLSRSMFDSIAPEFREKGAEVLAAHIAGKDMPVYELELIAKAGHRVAIEVNTRPIIENGVVVGVHGIARDITDRKRTQAALTESEERYRELVENALDIIYTHDLKGNYTSVNKAAEIITGYTNAEILAKNIADTIPADQLETARGMIAAKLAGKEVTAYELELLAKDGRGIQVEVNTRIIYENGVPVGVQGIARDITERKAHESARLASERKYQALFTLAPVGIYQSQPDGSLTTANDALAHMLGYDSTDELLTQNFADIYFDSDDRRSLLDKYERRGLATDIDLRWKKKDGSPVWIQLTAQTIKGQTGETEYFEGFVRDVTERKQAETEIEMTMQRLNAAQRLGRIGDWEWNAVTESITWSPEVFEITGRDPLLGPPADYEEMCLSYDAPSRELLKTKVAAAMESGEAQEYELVVVRPDGERLYMHALAEPRKDEDGNIFALVGTVQDISDRKEAELALRESEFRYHSLFENMIEGYAYCQTIFEGDRLKDFIYTEVNGAFGTLTGLKDVVGKKISEIIPEIAEVNSELFEIYGRAALTGQPEKFEIYMEALKIWLSITVYSSSRENFVAVFDNITERKLANYSLLESENRYRTLFETSPDGIAMFDVEMNVLMANAQSADIFGYANSNELIGVNAFDMISGENLLRARANIKGMLETGHLATIESVGVRADGGRFDAEFSATLIRNAVGEPSGVLGVTRDITQRKLAEAALNQSREQLTLAAESVNLGVWDWDIVEDVIEWDDRMYELYGVRAEDFGGAYDAWQKGLHPDDRKTGDDNIQAALSGERPFNNEFRVLWPNGEVHNIEARALVQRDDAGNPIRMIGVNWDITERKAAEAALKAAEENYRSIFENAVEGIFQSTNEGRFISANPAMARILGFDSPEALIKERTDIANQHYVDPVTRVELSAILEKDGVAAAYECEVYRKDGTVIWTQENIRAIRDTDGVISHYEGSMEDITARKSLEDQFRQSQKMEAVGVMAGGIAHDFNNLLTAINGYSDLTLRRMPADEPLRRNIEEVKKAGDRAAELTSQLLAFSRKQVLKPIVHNLNSVVVNIEKMLKRIIRENVELRTVLDPDLGNIKADPGQVEQVIMNLAVNARDAMPGGGTLTIETKNVYLDDDYISQKLAIAPGPFARLTVTDTGEGMDSTTQEHIFEPFFTTKEIGKGTGLGLSMVYGIVKQSGGDIMVYSEPGYGTSFRIYLPLVDELAHKPKWKGEREERYLGTETILLVEDEEVVRNLVKQILTGNGYTVLEAENGKSALTICSLYEGHIDMLLTDVIMPKMSGVELKQTVVKLLPDIKVLFMSGYTDDAIADRGVLDADKAFIEKPFTPDALSRKVREVLEY